MFTAENMLNNKPGAIICLSVCPSLMLCQEAAVTVKANVELPSPRIAATAHAIFKSRTTTPCFRTASTPRIRQTDR